MTEKAEHHASANISESKQLVVSFAGLFICSDTCGNDMTLVDDEP